ncbi:nuclear transport factor 2 family protein [Caulobacter sp. NIBR2454]|uniref:nuclear transport factor 2 family protein n=1 Tax=Caulobacter sp. NIBR2454 TaxID=3015996 RepID=UPI0022B65EB1|nr:nuclear transport factor 2 family protein [Caulobacter sp. NIBR2454]
MLHMILAAAAAGVIPTGSELKETLTKRDAEFFELFFQGCDAPRLRTMVTDDFEFFHDKDGLIATSGDQFVADYAKGCVEKQKPDAWNSRRELTPGTMKVWPAGGYGAFEQGDHVFYERKGKGPYKLVGKASFTQVWKLEDGVWKLARVLSYAHAPAD